jgi:hypothetical protein
MELSTTQLSFVLDRSSESLKKIRARFADFPRHSRQFGNSIFYDSEKIHAWLIVHERDSIWPQKPLSLALFDERLRELESKS